MPPKATKLSKNEKKMEKQKKNQERKTILLLEYLDREIKYGNVTRRKHERGWKELVMKIGLEKIRDDLEYTWQLFEWALDVKDCEISALMEEFDSANEQYILNVQNHNMVIRNLLNYMNENLKNLNEDFSNSLQVMRNSYNKKNSEIKEKCEELQYSMKTLLYRMEVDNETSSRDQMTHYFCLLESFSAAENQRESCEVIYTRKMMTLWNKSKIILDHHISSCENNMAMTQKDRIALDLSQATIRKNMKKIIYFIEVIKKLQAKLTYLYSTDGEHLRQLEDNHEEFTTYLFILKDKLFKDNTLDTNRKKLLVYSSQKTLDHFRRICRNGELLVRSISVNRRYETSNEKILSYPIERFLKLTSSKIDTQKYNPSAGDKLFLFHQKMAAADSSRIALMEEKKILQLERMQIKRKLQDYCGCLDCENKFPKPKREKPTRTLGYLERTELMTFIKWKHQIKEDKVSGKLHEFRMKMLGVEE